MINITEKDFMRQVEDLLKVLHWHWTHFRPARTEHGWRTAITGHKGFVDYVAVKEKRCLFIELKSENGKLTPSQEEWAELLKACPGVEYYCWRPSQIEDIASILR